MNERATYPLTHPQQRIWYTDKLYPGTSMWNNAGTLRIKGKLDYNLLRQAVLIFIQANPSLRLQVIEEDGLPLQYISENIPHQIDFIDLSGQGIQALYKWDSAQILESIKLIDSPLYYIAVLKLSDNEGCLFAKMHHLISDALSMVSFSGTIMKCYDVLLNNITVHLENFRLGNYLDFLVEEEKYMESPRCESDRVYWLNKFNDLSEPTVIKPRPANQGTRARRKTYMIDNELCSRVRSFCLKNRISEFTLFFSALAIYINRTSGKKDIVINTPVYNRTNRTNKNAFGMYVSTVPLRMAIQDDLCFTQFAEVVTDMWFSCLKHQKYPYDVLLHELRKNGGISDAPSDITLSFQTAMFEKFSEHFTYEGRWHFSGHQAGALNIHLNDRDAGGRYIMDYDFLTPMFTIKEIEYIHMHLMTIIMDIITNPHKPLYSIDILTAEEKERILVQFNDTYQFFPEGQTLTQVWRNWVVNTPESTAVICDGENFSYSEIDSKARALAKKLKQQGVAPNTIVGITMNRSAQVVAAELGILMAGGAFLPIDPDLPIERVLYMLENSGADILVTTDLLASRFVDQSATVVNVNKLENTEIIPEMINKSTDLAYIIYTSGSTGKPKGVMIEHGMLLHYINSTSSLLHYTQGYNTLCASSISFDISIMEIYCSLMNGGTLVMAMEHEVNIPSNMTALIKSAKINEMVLTPGRLELLLSDPDASDCLKNFADIVIGGDVLSPTLLANIQKVTKAKIYNFYGPTEITIAATCKDVTNSKEVNIGRPLRNVKTYILDEHFNPIPIGVLGELYIGGKGVARGYINNPELTSQRFMENPFCPGERLYRTGDLTRYFPLGEVEFLGRSDNQIKIRGYRVELGEIEERIKRIHGVGMCAVCAFDETSGRKALCAYICGDAIPSIVDIKSIIARDLPSYMVPTYYVIMESLPLNNSAKIDRARLPKPETKVLGLNGELPINDTEKKIASIWSNLLNVSQVGRNESFFDLGGDSLAIVQCVSLMKSRMGVQINLEELYRSPTIATCAILAENGIQSTDSIIISVPKKRNYPASSAQKRMYAINKSQPDNLAYNIPMLFTVNGVIDRDRLERTLIKIINRHEVLKTSLREQKGEIIQIIQSKVNFSLRHIFCRESEVKKKAIDLVGPFNLSEAPLIRVVVISADKQYLFIDMHHSVSDMHTVKLLLEEIDIIYTGGQLPVLSIQYKDYAVWQQNWICLRESKLQDKFWKDHLCGELPVLNLPSSIRRGAKQSFKGGEERIKLNINTMNKLRVIARAYGATMFMIVFAAYNILLSKYTGSEDIIVAVPHHGRTHQNMNNIAGMFVNTLPIRSKPTGATTVEQFLNIVKENCTDAFAASNYPLEVIIAGLDIIRDPSRNPLFDTMLSYQTEIENTIKLGELKLKPVKLPSKTSKLDLTLEVLETSNGLECRFEYDKSIFSSKDIKRMAQSFILLMNTLPEKLDAKLSELSVLSEEDLKKITQYLSGVCKKVEGDLMEVFEKIAVKHAQKSALIASDITLSFNELNKKSNAIALALRKSGVKSGDIIALAVKRNSGLIASIIGILKAGGAFLPIDLSYPSDRIAFMLSDSRVKTVILDNMKDLDLHFTGKRLYLDEISEDDKNPVSKAESSDPSCVIYTSSTTGVPKGVVLTRLGLLNLHEGCREQVGFNPDIVAISITSAADSLFVVETLLPLLNGSTVVLCDEEQLRQPRLIAKLMGEYSVSFLQSTTSNISKLMMDKAFRKYFAKLKIILGGGELWTKDQVLALRRHTHAKLVNGYSAIETTCYSSLFEIKNSNKTNTGHPIQNTTFHILDKYGKPVPLGVLGEAYVAGAGVGIGYINQLELTDERFLNNPFIENNRMYKTSDICSLSSNGEIVIHGRAEDRIRKKELRMRSREVEENIKKCSRITDAAVKYISDDGGYLCGFYTGDEDEAIIHSLLLERIPVYLIPEKLIHLSEFPMTENGEINRNALSPQMISEDATKIHMTGTQKLVAKIWSRILGVEVTSPDADFFSLGGDSLSVIKVQAAMHARGISVDTRDFYTLRILSAISEAVSFNKVKCKTHRPLHKKMIFNIPLTPVKLEQVLLTGSTGYAGAHILAHLIDCYNSKVHCLVRGKDKFSSTQALYKTLMFYFGNEAQRYMDSIVIYNGDITQSDLGLKDIKKALSDINCVIHSAALTSHVGDIKDFLEINVKGTSNIVSVCLKYKISLLYISTMSVSGTRYNDEKHEDKIFDEDCYYIGQDYTNNDYINSKFLAEGIVIDAVEEGLDARIFRAGNLTGRYIDGFFQMQPEKNAFARRIAAIAALKAVPYEMLDIPLELTPVDLFAQAMITIALSCGYTSRIFHLYNNNTVFCRDIIDVLNKLGSNVKEISEVQILRMLKKLNKSGEQPWAISALHEMSQTRNNDRIKVGATKTLNILAKSGFEWPIIKKEYLFMYIKEFINQKNMV